MHYYILMAVNVISTLTLQNNLGSSVNI